jgi:hypothetical protein
MGRTVDEPETKISPLTPDDEGAGVAAPVGVGAAGVGVAPPPPHEARTRVAATAAVAIVFLKITIRESPLIEAWTYLCRRRVLRPRMNGSLAVC